MASLNPFFSKGTNFHDELIHYEIIVKSAMVDSPVIMIHDIPIKSNACLLLLSNNL